MKLVTAALAVLLLLHTAPVCCSPWRKAHPDSDQGVNKALAKKQAPHRSTQPSHEPATASPSSLSSLSASLSDTDTSSSGNAFEVLQRMTAWLKQASDPSSAHKLSCSSDALSTWTDDCDALSASEEHRTQLSALLTICHHQRNSKASIPIDCLEWLQGNLEVDTCVDAFSRSPQYWTSFSSFSSSIHETCHALGREQNLAVFKKIFQKLLFHQQHFQDDIVEFELLKQEREKAMEEKLATWQGRLESFFNNAHQQFDTHSDSFASSLAKHSEKTREYEHELATLLHAFRTSVTQLPLTMREMAGREAETLRGHLYEAVKDFQKQNEVALKQHSSMTDLAMKKVREESEVALNEIVYGLGVQLNSIAKNIHDADLIVAKHTSDLKVMEDHGITILTIMSDIKTKAEDSVELALSQQAIIQRIFQDQIEATSKLVNATRQAYTDVLWGSIWSMNWLGIVMALKPCYKYYLSTTHLRLASTSVAISLLVASWPEYFRYITYIPSIVHRILIGLYKFANPVGPPPEMSFGVQEPALAPWRMEEAKEWFAV